MKNGSNRLKVTLTFVSINILIACSGKPLKLRINPYPKYSPSIPEDTLFPGLHIRFIPELIEKHKLTGKLEFSNTSPDTLRLHPDIGEFIVLDLETTKGRARAKQFTYDFWGLDWSYRIMVPCNSPIVVPPRSLYRYSMEFSGRHFGVWTKYGYNVQEGRFRLTKYSRFRVRYDSKYNFEKLPNHLGPLPNGGCYFCCNENWGYSAFFKSKFSCDQLARSFEQVQLEASEKCGIPYSKLVVESNWMSFKK